MIRTHRTLVLGTGLLLAGCATLFGSLKNDYESATLVDNPAVSGQVAAGVDGGRGATGRSSVRMQSFDKGSGKLCFVVSTPNPESVEQLALAAYDDGAAIEKRQESGGKAASAEKAAKVRTLSTANQVETYESTETVTHKDSSGMVIATSEKPVTKTMTYTVHEMEACFPGKVLKKTSKYMGLEHTSASLFGEQTVIVAAWRFGGNDITTH